MGRFSTVSVPSAPAYRTGYSYGTPGTIATGNSGGNGSLRAVPFVAVRTQTFDRIGAEVTAAGEAGSVVRLGIYYDDGNGAPSGLFLDAGTIDGTVLSHQTIAQTFTLGAGIWWLASCPQLCPTTAPTLRLLSSPPPGLGYNGTPSATTPVGYAGTSTTSGGLPSTFGTPTTQGNTTRVMLRAA